jgi:hypothetical protein
MMLDGQCDSGGIGTRRWVRRFRVGRVTVGIVLMKHTYAPGHGHRWVLQTSSHMDGGR